MTTKRNTPALAGLAERINAEHAAARTAFRKCLEHAILAGELLIEAKDKLDHGGWLPWLRANCAVSERTAQLYMKVAREKPRLEAKTASLADLTLEEAARQLARSNPDTCEHGGLDGAADVPSLLEIGPTTPTHDLIQAVDLICRELDRRQEPHSRQWWTEEIKRLNSLVVASLEETIGLLEEQRGAFESIGRGDQFDPWVRAELPHVFAENNPVAFMLDYPGDAQAYLAALKKLRDEASPQGPVQ